MRTYLLEGDVVEECHDIALFFAELYRRDEERPNWREVARDAVPTPDGEIVVSTIFLGLDHGRGRATDRPVLFQTIVWGGPEDGQVVRHKGLVEALDHHQQIVANLAVRAMLYAGTLEYAPQELQR